MSETASICKHGLPKREQISFGDIGTWLGVILGIYGVYQLGQHSDSANIRWAIGTLTAMLIILLGNRLVVFLQKKHRYAQAVFFMHYINHRIRDSLEKRLAGQDDPDVLGDLADAISQCFSVVSARYCRCAIITVNKSQQIEVLARDVVSREHRKPSDGQTHTVSKNTDFSDLFKGTHWRPRCFLENNLPRLYAQNKYKNSSLVRKDMPRTRQILDWKFTTYWPLKYKSALVLPIRYMRVAKPQKSEDFQIHGFLCIDSSSKNTFSNIYDVELGGAFADILYTYFSQVRYITQKRASYQTAEETLQSTMEA